MRVSSGVHRAPGDAARAVGGFEIIKQSTEVQ
jgi:hypothetical protein